MGLTMSRLVPGGTLAARSNRSSSSQCGPPVTLSASTPYATRIKSTIVAWRRRKTPSRNEPFLAPVATGDRVTGWTSATSKGLAGAGDCARSTTAKPTASARPTAADFM